MAVINRFSDHSDITLLWLGKGTVAKKAWEGGKVGGAGREREQKGMKISEALPCTHSTSFPHPPLLQQASHSKWLVMVLWPCTAFKILQLKHLSSSRQQSLSTLETLVQIIIIHSVTRSWAPLRYQGDRMWQGTKVPSQTHPSSRRGGSRSAQGGVCVQVVVFPPSLFFFIFFSLFPLSLLRESFLKRDAVNAAALSSLPVTQSLLDQIESCSQYCWKGKWH